MDQEVREQFRGLITRTEEHHQAGTRFDEGTSLDFRYLLNIMYSDEEWQAVSEEWVKETWESLLKEAGFTEPEINFAYPHPFSLEVDIPPIQMQINGEEDETPLGFGSLECWFSLVPPFNFERVDVSDFGSKIKKAVGTARQVIRAVVDKVEENRG